MQFCPPFLSCVFGEEKQRQFFFLCYAISSKLINHSSPRTFSLFSSWNSWIKSMKYWNCVQIFLYHRMKVHVKCQFRRWRMTCVPKKIILIFREATRELTLQLFCTDGNSHRKNSGWCRLKVLSCCKISYVFLSFFLSWNSVDDLYHLASKPVGHQAPIPNLEY